jgi:hypothetical protein
MEKPAPLFTCVFGPFEQEAVVVEAKASPSVVDIPTTREKHEVVHQVHKLRTLVLGHQRVCGPAASPTYVVYDGVATLEPGLVRGQCILRTKDCCAKLSAEIVRLIRDVLTTHTIEAPEGRKTAQRKAVQRSLFYADSRASQQL